MSITIEIHDDQTGEVRRHPVRDGEVVMITVVPLATINPLARPDQFSVTVLSGTVGAEVTVEKLGAS